MSSMPASITRGKRLVKASWQAVQAYGLLGVVEIRNEMPRTLVGKMICRLLVEEEVQAARSSE
jgi:hypothetical protein